MYIYDGPNTASPVLGTYTGINSPGTIWAPSGCITIRFTSDGSVTSPGWVAIIGCGTPPPPPTPTFRIAKEQFLFVKISTLYLIPIHILAMGTT